MSVITPVTIWFSTDRVQYCVHTAQGPDVLRTVTLSPDSFQRFRRKVVVIFQGREVSGPNETASHPKRPETSTIHHVWTLRSYDANKCQLAGHTAQLNRYEILGSAPSGSSHFIR